MSTQPVTLDWPTRDVQALMAQMRRAGAQLNMRLPQIMRFAAKSVLDSIAASTKVAARFRDYVSTGIRSRSGKNMLFLVRTKYRTPARRGKALRRSWQGDWRDQPIWAASEEVLKTRRAVINQMRGLAKQSWKEAGARGRIRVTKAEVGGSRDARNTRIMRKAARRWVGWTARLGGADPFIQVDNSLRYIHQALQGGPQDVATAMERAARSMAHQIDRKLGTILVNR